MKTLQKTILFAALAFISTTVLSGCKEEFVEDYDMAVDSNALVLDPEEGTIVIGCYCSGEWTASLSEDIEWGSIDLESGKGTSFIHFTYTANEGLSRSVDLNLFGNGKKQTIKITQKSGIIDPYLRFVEETIEFANGSYEGRITIDSNIPDKELEAITPEIALEDGMSQWFTDFTYHPSEVTTDGEGVATATPPYLSFTVEANTSGESRMAIVSMMLIDSDETQLEATATLSQSAEDAYIDFSEISVSKDEHLAYQVEWQSNIMSLTDQMEYEVVYEGTDRDYVSNIVLGKGTLTFDLASNEGGRKRISKIRVMHTDLAGTVTEGILTINQRGEVLPNEISVEALRNKLTAAGSLQYLSDEDMRDYVMLRVITGKENPNTEMNPNTNWNAIDFTASARTGYAQSEDGKYGFRLQFASTDDNTLEAFSKVRLYLDGTTLSLENNPDRYTISNIKAQDIVVETSGTISDLPVKERTIATISDLDVYTHVTLTDMEFVVKDGPYTYGIETMIAAPGHDIRDNLATMMQDADNNAIYALINSNCTWRRDNSTGKTVPKGVGRASGVIVHTVDPAYGDMGRFQLRPLDESSFDIPSEEAFANNILARWSLTKSTVSIGQYVWNGGGTSNNGYKIGNTSTMNQNKMHATHGITDGSAVLYTTNLTMINGATTGHPAITGGYASTMNNYQYQPAIICGTKGTTDEYSASIGDMLGQSKSTALVFRHDVASYYEWNNGKWTGNTTGIIVEFPATQASGTLSISFTTSAMQVGSIDNSGVPKKHFYKGLTHSFPLYWKVECSTDGGNSWELCTNTVNGSQEFEMRSVVNWLSGNNNMVNPVTSAVMNPYTPTAMPAGFIQEKFTLPASATGAFRVMVKISPKSLRLASFGATFSDSIDTGVDCTETTKYPSAFMLEDVVVTY